MKNFNFMAGLVLISVILTSGCVSQVSPLKLKPEVLTPKEPTGIAEQFYACENYALGKELGYPITTNNQAFDILREYWFSCQEDTPELEDCIPSDMTGDKAIQKEPAIDPYFRYTTISLENNQTIQAWVLNWNYAVDKSGNVYGCFFD